jgi:hypothetical protein
MIIGTIGQGTALGFTAHRKTSALLPDPSQILRGKVKDLQTKEISAMWTLSTSLAYELKAAKEDVGRGIDKETMEEYVDNVIGFWMEHFQPEMVVMSFRMVIKYDIKINMKTANWKDFYGRYGDLVRDA